MLTFRDQAFLASLKSSGVTPASFPGLHRWYDANSFAALGTDGDTVGGGTNTLGPWIDKTGSGDDATAVTGPVYKTNIVGTKPVIRFTTEFMLFAPGSLTDFTVIAVYRQTGTTSMLLQNPGQLRISFLGDNTRLFFDGTGIGQAANAWASPAAVNVIACSRTGSTVTFRENKTSRGSFVYSNANFDVVEIGSSSLGGSIDLAELMIWTTPVADVDKDALYDQYLKPRWTTLP